MDWRVCIVGCDSAHVFQGMELLPRRCDKHMLRIREYQLAAYTCRHHTFARRNNAYIIGVRHQGTETTGLTECQSLNIP